jgi:hypothetical protein
VTSSSHSSELVPVTARPVVRAIVLLPAVAPFELSTPTVIGSDPARCDLVLTDASVAPAHAVLTAADDAADHWQIRDLGSLAGTFVDGRPVATAAVLDGAHELSIGRVRLPFLLDLPARLIAGRHGGRIERGTMAVELDAEEFAFLRALHGDERVGPGARAFVRTGELAAIIAPTSVFASDGVRALARRLERRLRVLGEPAVLEACARRGFRLRASVR